MSETVFLGMLSKSAQDRHCGTQGGAANETGVSRVTTRPTLSEVLSDQLSAFSGAAGSPNSDLASRPTAVGSAGPVPYPTVAGTVGKEPAGILVPLAGFDMDGLHGGNGTLALFANTGCPRVQKERYP